MGRAGLEVHTTRPWRLSLAIQGFARLFEGASIRGRGECNGSGNGYHVVDLASPEFSGV